jgi:hypothetical protein
MGGNYLTEATLRYAKVMPSQPQPEPPASS